MLDAPLADARAFLNQTPALHTKTLAPWTLSSFSTLTCAFTAIPRLDPHPSTQHDRERTSTAPQKNRLALWPACYSYRVSRIIRLGRL